MQVHYVNVGMLYNCRCVAELNVYVFSGVMQVCLVHVGVSPVGMPPGGPYSLSLPGNIGLGDQNTLHDCRLPK